MADVTVVGVLKTAAQVLNPTTPDPEIVGFEGHETISGQDIYYQYDKRLNPLAALPEVDLIEIDHTAEPYNPYDYIVVGSGGLQAKTEWFSSIDEQVLWNTVAIDAQVYVATQSDFSDEVAAHFAAYESADPAGKPYYVFKDGKTSFTAPGSREAYTISFPGFTGQGGKYFRIYSTTTDGDKYYVWFNLDPHLGGSTDPAIVDYTPVQVDILTGDTAAAIAQKTYNKLITGVAEAVAWGDPWPTDPGAQPTRDFYAMHNSGTNVIYLVVKGGTTTYDANVGTSGVSITIAAQGGDTINYQYARLP